eukprot:CAMPEP_0179337690 /NCGR_PEP_ID=MMETSP0797-20121207/67765_1 /TAXON_ID=47934 /ORGANISM="Dinophysis acuminata, Strain DAEP01" /LENGTH=165 /DNA_ID=CAMNT_0021051369 /DNA_START=446 /DNA_END=940 /DNA_ORIENTATION=-
MPDHAGQLQAVHEGPVDEDYAIADLGVRRSLLDPQEVRVVVLQPVLVVVRPDPAGRVRGLERQRVDVVHLDRRDAALHHVVAVEGPVHAADPVLRELEDVLLRVVVPDEGALPEPLEDDDPGALEARSEEYLWLVHVQPLVDGVCLITSQLDAGCLKNGGQAKRQ